MLSKLKAIKLLSFLKKKGNQIAVLQFSLYFLSARFLFKSQTFMLENHITLSS